MNEECEDCTEDELCEYHQDERIEADKDQEFDIKFIQGIL